MTCSRGRLSIDGTTKLRLFADSGGYCQKPDCGSELFRDIDDETIQIGEIAHIISAADNGPRADGAVSAQARAKYDNLILLCPTCHTIVDKAEAKYPEALINEWKRSHKKRIDSQFGAIRYETREDARTAIAPLLRENYTIFTQYGPMTDERFNPESSLPRQWLSKIRTRIIPNNRKILAITDANAANLTPGEIEILEQFRQHVQDFEAKHIGESKDNGRQFPQSMRELFS